MFRYFAVFSVLVAASLAAPIEESDKHVHITFNHVEELKEFNENFLHGYGNGYTLIEVFVDLGKDKAYSVVAGNEKFISDVKAYLDEKHISYEITEHESSHSFKATVKMSMTFRNGKLVEEE